MLGTSSPQGLLPTYTRSSYYLTNSGSKFNNQEVFSSVYWCTKSCGENVRNMMDVITETV